MTASIRLPRSRSAARRSLRAIVAVEVAAALARPDVIASLLSAARPTKAAPVATREANPVREEAEFQVQTNMAAPSAAMSPPVRRGLIDLNAAPSSMEQRAAGWSAE